MNEKLALRQYQRDAGKFVLDKKACYLALDMGLGKTAISLAASQKIIPIIKSGVLIVAPLRGMYLTWPDECAKWTPTLSYAVLHGADKKNKLKEKKNLYFINYDGLPWLFEALRDVFKTTKTLPFRALVLDEGSMVKSSRTKRFKILKKLLKVFPEYRWILSGTPAPNSLADLWSQYYLLDEGNRLGHSFSGFRSKYFTQVDKQGFVWAIKPGSADEIHSVVADITYRLDAADHLELPERIDNIIKVPLNTQQRAQYLKLEKEFFLALDGVEVEVFNKATLSMKLRQFLQGALYIDDKKNYEIVHEEKLKVLKELVETANGQGILCAIQFRFELDIICKAFPGTPFIAGGTSSEKATKYMRAWNRGEIPLLLCHPASLSHSVNIQAGSHIIVWYGLTWSHEQFQQLNARLIRYGQKSPFVIVHHLVIEKSVDERMLAVLKRKFATQKDFLDFLRGYNHE